MGNTHRNEDDKAEVELAILRRCEQCPREDRLSKIEAKMSDVEQHLARQEGAAQEAAKSAGFRAGLYAAVLTTAVTLGLFFANRIWPPPATHAYPVAQQAPGGPTP